MLRLKPNTVPYRVPTPNNMGVVRYILALGVIISHFKTLTQADFWFSLSAYARIGGFFALSGFLIYGSYLKRRQFGSFMLDRIVRLLPAYAFTVILFAILLVGFSTLSASEYFGSVQFWKYLVSNLLTLNFLEPSLPGVFTDNAAVAVNGSLWTMKVEFLFFFSVPLVVWAVSKIKASPTLIFVLVYLASAIYRIYFHELYIATGSPLYQTLGKQLFGQFTYFYCGVMIYYWLDVFIRYKWWILAANTILWSCQTYIPWYDFLVGPWVISSTVLWFSMVGRWGTWEYKRDNVSYNMYLLHFPIIQIAIALGLPASLGLAPTFFIALAAILILSVLINKYVETPIQRSWKEWRRRHGEKHNLHHTVTP